MDANDYILGVYAGSGALGIVCAMLPGTGLFGRLLFMSGGVCGLGWATHAFLLGGWYYANPMVTVVPLLMVIYVVLRVSLHRNRSRAWFSPVGTPAGGPLPPAAPVGPPPPERRRTTRRSLPGEYNSIPPGQLPPPHDPWAALYASVEREIMRSQPGRHRERPRSAEARAAQPAGRPLADTAVQPTIPQQRSAT